jgi:hypothetical protein
MPLTKEEEARYKQLMMERTAYEQQSKAMTHFGGDYGI